VLSTVTVLSVEDDNQTKFTVNGKYKGLSWSLNEETKIVYLDIV